MITSAGTFLRPMRPRDPRQEHRVATPLELLTDLCFVVAIAQAAAQLHHVTAEGQLLSGLLPFAMAFFAIWWAWLNFTWFASAYDNGDVAYRLLTILQIVGSLVLAAGVPQVFDGNLTLAVIGYVIMRVGLVVQWLRAAAGDPDCRRTCLRYAIGISVVQVCWIVLLFLPAATHIPLFFVLLVAELSVPMIAEQAGRTAWHPHHVAERYSLLFIIVLGETILSTTVAIQEGMGREHSAASVVCVAAGGVMIVFSLWWLYFSRSGGVALERAVSNGVIGGYIWGFGHYLIFASGAALGSGLAARVDFWTRHGEAPGLHSAALVTVPVAVLLAAMWFLHLRHHDASVRTLLPFGLAVLLTLGATLTPVPELMVGLICVVLVVVEVRLAGLINAPD